MGIVEIHEQRMLPLDGSRATRALERYVDALNAIGGAGSLQLKAPVLLPNIGAEIELRNGVTALLSAGQREDGMASANVTWFASQAQAFPLRGGLRIVPATPQTAWLRFDAQYCPMPSTVRLAAPAENVVGHRIVLATARRLLHDVAAAIVSSEEARERGGSS